MPYQIGSAPPGLRGFLLSRANQQAESQQELQAMQGALGLQGLLMKQQMAPLEMELMRAKVDEYKRKSELPKLLEGYFSGGLNGGATGASPDRATAELAAIERIAVLDPPRGKALLDVWKERNPHIKFEGGIPIHPRTGPMTDMQTIPRTVSGEGTGTPVFNPVTKQWEIQETPGASQMYANRQDIEQRTRAKYDLVNTPPLAPNLPPTRGSRLEALGVTPPAQPPVRSPVQPNAFFSGPGNQVPPRDPQVAANLDAGRTPSGAPGIPTSAVVGRPAGMSPQTEQDFKVEGQFRENVNQNQAKAVVENRKVAQDAVEIVTTVNEGRKLLDSGVITGFGAEYLTNVGRALSKAGFTAATDPVANTQAFTATMAQNVGKLIKAFGAGTGLSDADREFAEKMAGGKITMEEKAIRRIFDISERASRNVIKRHNDDVKGVKSMVPLSVPEPDSYSSPKKVKRTGTYGGKKVVEYEDGTMEYVK